MRQRLRMTAPLGLAGLALGLVILAGPAENRAADDKGKKPAAGALPADLARVPTNALGLISVRVGDLWEHKTLREVRTKLPEGVVELNKQFEKAIGITLADLDRFTVVATQPRGQEPFLYFIHTRKPYERANLLANIGASREVKVGKETYHLGTRNRAVYLIDGQTFVLGLGAEVRWLLESPEAKKAGPLADAVRQAAGKHTAVAGVNPAAIPAEIRANLPPAAEPFLPLFEAQGATLTVNLADTIRGELRVGFAGKKEAKEGATALEALLVLARMGLATGIKELEAGDKDMKAFAALLQQGHETLKDAKVQAKGDTVSAGLALKVDMTEVVPVLAAMVHKARIAAARAQGANNLKQLGLAMHNYHDVHGRFPPPAVYDREGKPLLSWRVLILPFVEADDLYKEFRLNEPWDSEHNKKLLAKMPPVFKAPTEAKAPPHTTFYQGVAGKGTIWDNKRGTRITEIFDGTSNTIMVVEGGKAVPWSKPEDVPFDPDQKIPKLGGLYPGGFQATFCDGSVRFIADSVKPEILKLLFLRADGTPVPPF